MCHLAVWQVSWAIVFFPWSCCPALQWYFLYSKYLFIFSFVSETGLLCIALAVLYFKITSLFLHPCHPTLNSPSLEILYQMCPTSKWMSLGRLTISTLTALVQASITSHSLATRPLCLLHPVCREQMGESSNSACSLWTPSVWHTSASPAPRTTGTCRTWWLDELPALGETGYEQEGTCLQWCRWLI